MRDRKYFDKYSEKYSDRAVSGYFHCDVSCREDNCEEEDGKGRLSPDISIPGAMHTPVNTSFIMRLVIASFRLISLATMRRHRRRQVPAALES